MSAYENVVGGKLKLKGKALDVKAGGMKKKKTHKKHHDQLSLISENELSTGAQVTDGQLLEQPKANDELPNSSSYAAFGLIGVGFLTFKSPFGQGGSTGLSIDDPNQEDGNDANKSTGEGHAVSYDEHLTPAERRYMEQKEKIDVLRLAKTADKSHRDRIQDFNQYLANMSEHYDIPKVGPG